MHFDAHLERMRSLARAEFGQAIEALESRWAKASDFLTIAKYVGPQTNRAKRCARVAPGRDGGLWQPLFAWKPSVRNMPRTEH
jgi:hypothetical protein